MRKTVTELAMPEQGQRLIRLAPYTRVSSGSDDQLHSFAAQVKYYTEYAAAHPEYELVDIYADAAVIIGLKTLRLKKSQKHAAF